MYIDTYMCHSQSPLTQGWLLVALITGLIAKLMIEVNCIKRDRETLSRDISPDISTYEAPELLTCN